MVLTAVLVPAVAYTTPPPPRRITAVAVDKAMMRERDTEFPRWSCVTRLCGRSSSGGRPSGWSSPCVHQRRLRRVRTGDVGVHHPCEGITGSCVSGTSRLLTHPVFDLRGRVLTPDDIWSGPVNGA